MLSSFPGLIWPSGVRTGCGFLGLESLTGYIMSLFSARPWTGCLFGPVEVGDERSKCVVQSNPVITDTEGGHRKCPY